MEKFLTLNLQKKIPLFLAPKCLCVLFAPPILIVLKNPPFLPASFSYKYPKYVRYCCYMYYVRFFSSFSRHFFVASSLLGKIDTAFPFGFEKEANYPILYKCQYPKGEHLSSQ